MNQDGKRPDTLNFALSRTADGTTAAVKTEHDASSEYAADTTGTNWRVDFGIQPRFNENNTEYVYSVEEAAASGDTLETRGYTRYVLTTPSGEGDKSSFTIKEGASSENNDYGLVTSETVSGVTEKTFHFLNRYTPLKDTLTVNKNWIDDGTFYTWTRPDSVYVDLCYSIDGGDRVNLYTAGNDDPVKKLLKQADANYAFRKEIKATDNWTGSFADLPLNVNPTGTIVFNGQSYQITYSVEEVTDAPLNGYTKNDSASTVLNTSTDDSVTVDNTLKTTTVSVRKVWKDGYEGNQAEHYDVNLILSNLNPNLDGAQNTILYGTIVAASKSTSLSDTTTEAIEFVVPQYVKGGTPASYRVDEDVSDQKYGYITTYTNNVFDTPGVDPVVTVTNTLPLTQVSVTKEWDDESNKYNLRQNINVTLQRKLPTEENWTDCEAVTLTPQNVTVSGNSWTYTFAQLSKFNVANLPFEYRVVEAKVNAYDTYYKDGDNYVPAPVAKQDDSNSANSNMSFDVKNTLITEDITLKKVWDETNHRDTHYPVTYTIKQPQGVQIDFDSQVDYDTTGVTFGNANDTSTLWTTTVSGVPVYDRNGNAIEYTVEEISAQHYGYHQSGATVTTQEGVHTGNGNYYDTYQITNSLPVTDVTAVKHWAGSTELYPNTDVKVNLTRKSNNVIDRNFDEEETITYVDDGTDDSVTYTNLLAKDYNNNPYTYTVTEQMVRGYTTNYGNQNVLSTAQNRTVTITNTPITNDAYFVKYDVTDLEKHGSDSRFGLRAIPNAQFELYRVRENQADKKFWATGSDGIYNIAEDNAAGATSTLVTGTGGRLNIYGLEPNRYYLQEIGNPNGYQHTDTKFYFTVSVDENNQQSVIYVSQLAHKVNGKLLLDYDPFTADAAKNTLTEFIPNLIHGIPNEENMSHLTLTKVDANNSDPNTNKLPNATYYLLRLYNYEYRKSGAEYDTKSEYLTNALATLGEDYSDTSNLWTYWEKIAVKSTDSNGQITFDGHMFGTYVFYEVKAPTGYERDFTHNNDTATTDDTTNPQNTQVIGPVYLDSHNADHGEVTHSLTHLEPRSKAHINVLKTDENGNPLKNAVFKLYRKGDDSTVLTTFTTGYDGMNPTAFEIDTSQYAWGTEFYLTEETPPIGYDADNVPVQNRIEFTLTPELAEEVVHIVRANDVRLKGKADLTKVSSSQTTTVSAGDPLGGAQFELYAKDGNQPLSLYPHTTNTNTYRVVNIVEDDLAALAVEGFNTTPVTMLTTSGTAGDELGKLHIEGLDWGDYYLLETQAPTGYKTPAGEDAKVYFSVGRTNSGSTAQQLTMKNDPDTASLNITKQIDAKNVAAWGEPVFIFKVKQTKRYDYANDGFVPLDAANQRTLTKTISPSTSVTEGYRDSTGKFDVEPGTYSITEMRVARYSASGNAVISEISADKVLDKSVTPTTATLSVKPGGEAEITFSNQLKTYEKLSHADKKTNTFNGYKALEVHDKAGLALSPAPATNMYTATVEKSALTPQLIRSDGTKTDITSDFSKLVITRNAADTEFTLFDNGATITIKGRREDLAGSSYKLTATYDNKFTDEFELSFSPVTLFDKTEKTVVFRNDALNRSHYMDGENETNIYSLMFVLETGVPGETVKTVLHNGTVLNSTDQSVFPTPVIESDYSGWEFDKWSYSYSNGGTVYTAEVDNAGLLNAIKTAPNNAEIIVTAVLKVKSS